MPVRLRSKLIGLLLLLAPAGLLAAGSCNVAVTPVAFGAYDEFSLVPTDATGTVMVSCSDDGIPGGLNVDVTIGLSASASSGSISNRQMTRAGGSERLDYNLYRDAGFSQIWGNTPGVDTLLIPKVKVPKKGSMTVTPPAAIYGRIPPGQSVSVGNYSDTVVLTITP